MKRLVLVTLKRKQNPLWADSEKGIFRFDLLSPVTRLPRSHAIWRGTVVGKSYITAPWFQSIWNIISKQTNLQLKTRKRSISFSFIKTDKGNCGLHETSNSSTWESLKLCYPVAELVAKSWHPHTVAEKVML